MAMLARRQPQLQIRPDRGSLRRGALEGLGCFRRVPRGQSDNRGHNQAPVIGQPPDDACGTGLVAQTKTQPGFELIGLGKQDGVIAFERRPCGGQRGESLVEVAAGRPDPGPVQLGKIAEGRPGTADYRQCTFDRFGGRSQVASLQREQGRGPHRVEVEIVALEVQTAGRGVGAGGQGGSLVQVPLEKSGLADHPRAQDFRQRSAHLGVTRASASCRAWLK
jgi:hypothetical protein